jgi:hypothetical protein
MATQLLSRSKSGDRAKTDGDPGFRDYAIIDLDAALTSGQACDAHDFIA